MKQLLLTLCLLLLPVLALAEGVQGISAPYPIFLSSAVVTADTAIKASPGYVKYMVCIGSDAAATAGTIKLFDNTAESGTLIVDWDVLAVAYNTPVIFPVERAFGTGIYLGYTTTSDVKCYVVYR